MVADRTRSTGAIQPDRGVGGSSVSDLAPGRRWTAHHNGFITGLGDVPGFPRGKQVASYLGLILQVQSPKGSSGPGGGISNLAS